MTSPTAKRSRDTALNMPAAGRVGLTHFAGRAGDHNDLAMVGSRQLARALATRFGTEPVVIGEPEPALSIGWAEELAASMPTLRSMASRLDQVFGAGLTPVSASSRCAVALATLPMVAARRPDAVVVWFDGHADLNTPDTTTTGYLGGLAYSGPLGFWDSGLGSGLAADNAILVGRDIDPPELELIDAGAVTLVKVGPSMANDLWNAIAGRPVYVHIDCDVLDAGTVPTDYLVPGGMTLDDLRDTANILAASEVDGIEVGELESATDPHTPPSYVTRLLDALDPLLHAAQRARRTRDADMKRRHGSTRSDNRRMAPVLIATAGLPSSGKSAMGREDARAPDCASSAVDPIEAAMWRAGAGRDQPTGLAASGVAEDLAWEQPLAGNDVIRC